MLENCDYGSETAWTQWRTKSTCEDDSSKNETNNKKRPSLAKFSSADNNLAAKMLIIKHPRFRYLFRRSCPP